MIKMFIGLVLAAAIVVAVCIGLGNFLSDYLIDNGSWIPDLDWERFLYDACNTYVDGLYESASESTAPETAPSV